MSRRKRLDDVVGVMMLATAVVLFLSLVSFDPLDPSPFFGTGDRAVQNLIGPLGAFAARLLGELIGLAAFGLPIALAYFAWTRFTKGDHKLEWTRGLGTGLFFLAFCSLLQIARTSADEGGSVLAGGGLLGLVVSDLLIDTLHRTGAMIVVITLLLVSIPLCTELSLDRTASNGKKFLQNTGRRITASWARFQKRRKKKQVQKRVRRTATNTPSSVGKEGSGDKKSAKRPSLVLSLGRRKRDKAAAVRVVKKVEPAQKTSAVAKPLKASQPALRFARKKGFYEPPPDTIFDETDEANPIDEKELVNKAKLLTEKCQEFSVGGSVAEIHPGPIVTTFEFKPDAGVKYSKVASLSEDLCLALEAESIRIDRISGKSTIGIEVPNRKRETIFLHDILRSKEFLGSPSKLTLAIGKRIDGSLYVSDLAKMPHLLIAGATGSGKSVALTSMVSSILYRANPDEAKFILIDPKMLELVAFDEIPHLLHPVVTDCKKAANALQWAVREMESRYRLLAAAGVRNIDQYNRTVRESGEVKGVSEEEQPRPLHYIVVVIDELADLMIVSSSVVETAITRLAQMARAVGIHLILATQRPSVDVITGVIKANFPCRISFRVSSKVDSRTILDANGAEQLLGRGDMLFMPPGSSRLLRIHGPMITDAEKTRFVEYLKSQSDPTYDEKITQEGAGDEGAAEDGNGGVSAAERDALYEEASRLVVRTGSASVSNLQRRLKLGYNRAARIVDIMEEDGLVGPPIMGKPRKVLVEPDYFDEIETPI